MRIIQFLLLKGEEIVIATKFSELKHLTELRKLNWKLKGKPRVNPGLMRGQASASFLEYTNL